MFESPCPPVSSARPFQKRFRIPLAPLDAEKVSAVDVNRARQAPDGVGHGMDDVFSQLDRVFFTKGLCSRDFKPPAAVGRQASPENSVFSAGVGSTHGT